MVVRIAPHRGIARDGAVTVLSGKPYAPIGQEGRGKNSAGKVAQLLGGEDTLPGAAADGEEQEPAVRAGLPFTAVRRLIESGRLGVAEVTALALPRTTHGRRARGVS